MCNNVLRRWLLYSINKQIDWIYMENIFQQQRCSLWTIRMDMVDVCVCRWLGNIYVDTINLVAFVSFASMQTATQSVPFYISKFHSIQYKFNLIASRRKRLRFEFRSVHRECNSAHHARLFDQLLRHRWCHSCAPHLLPFRFSFEMAFSGFGKTNGTSLDRLSHGHDDSWNFAMTDGRSWSPQCTAARPTKLQ